MLRIIFGTYIMNAYNSGKGKCIQFLRENVAYAGDDCLLWPYASLPNGYGHLGYLGKVHYSHRLMCELAHGPKPTPEHGLVRHSCHNPRCVNPRHVSWGTASQNMLDKRANGTASLNGGQGRRGKLTPEQVAEIKSLKGEETLAATATRFNVTIKTIRSAQNGETYSGKELDWYAINQRSAPKRRGPRRSRAA